MANVAIQTPVKPVTLRRIEPGVYVVSSAVMGREFRVEIERLSGKWYASPKFESPSVPRPLRRAASNLRDAKRLACELISKGMRDLSMQPENNAGERGVYIRSQASKVSIYSKKI